MKSIKIAAVLICLSVLITLLGCNSEAERAAKNKAIILQTIDVLNNHEYEKLDQFFGKDYRRYCQATPNAKVESLDDFKSLLSEWDQQSPDAQTEIQLIAAEGDLVAFYATYSGTREDQMGEFPATGKKMAVECAGFHRLVDGKIVETWVTWDNVAILKQLGLFPQPTSD